MARLDENIKADLVDELYWDDKVDASDVKVEVSDGKVILSGTVPNYSARTAALNDAWMIDGVIEVHNFLIVQLPSTFTIPSDAEIESGADLTLDWNPVIDTDDIDVSVADGVVRLDGSVDAYWKRWKAEDLVSDLKGVIDVENHLTVVPEGDFLARDIASDIESALERNLYVDAEKVTVKVEDGKATLTGTVPSYYARGRAYSAAAYTPGVVEVDNNILVT